MMRTTLRRIFTAVLAVGVAAPIAVAQQSDPLIGLDSATRRVVQSLIDSARHGGLPEQLIVSKAQEGISKHASGPVIAQVVRKVFLSLREARMSLGPKADRDEMAAGAAALQAGIPPEALVDLHQAGHGKSVAVPLVVLADLVTRGVPRDTASREILKLWLGGAGDADLLGLPRAVQQDIVSGAAPADALLNRARTIRLRPPPVKVPE